MKKLFGSAKGANGWDAGGTNEEIRDLKIKRG
jgi:hypothetical protein